MTKAGSWEERYERAAQAGISRLESIPGVALGFHTNIDGLVKLVPGLVEKAFAGLDSARIFGFLDSPDSLKDIRCPEDFVAGLLMSLESGSAKQLMIKEERVYEWLMEKLPPERLRLGGTTANMSNALSGLPVRRILNYAFPLTRQQAELFPERDNILALVRSDGAYKLKVIREAYEGEGLPSCHWVLEYPRGLDVVFGGRKFVPPRASRFIGAWNPSNSRLRIQESFKEGFLGMAGSFSHFFVSGFHIMSESYPEGATCEDYIGAAAEFLGQVREKAPDLCLHCELASMASSRIRKAVFAQVVPKVHSVGLNETELRTVLGDMGQDDLAARVKAADPSSLVHAARWLLETTGLERLHLHCPNLYVAVLRGNRWEETRARDGLLFSAQVAAGRAATGTVSPEGLAAGARAPVSPEGISALAEIERAVPGSAGLADEGIARTANGFFIAVPTRWVDNPQFTVGLGDTISSSALLAS